MGFLDKLFGSSGKDDVTLVLSPEEFAQQLAAEQQKREAALEKELAKSFSSVKHVTQQLRGLVAELEARDLRAEGGHGRLRQIVETAKRKLVFSTRNLLQKIEPPAETAPAKLRDYCLRALPTLEREITSFGKDIAYTGVVLKQEIRLAGEYVAELHQLLQQMNQAFNASGLDDIASASKNLQQLNDHQQRVAQLAGQLAEKEAAAAAAEQRLAKKCAELSSLQRGEEASELERFRARKADIFGKKRELKNRFLGLLNFVDKPLKRLAQLVDSNHYALEKADADTLRLFSANPFEALQHDPQGEQFKRLLDALEKAVQDGTVSLKEGEREKRLEAITDLRSFDFHAEFAGKLAELDGQLRQADAVLANSSLNEKLGALEREALALERELGEHRISLKAIQQERDSLEQQLLAAKPRLEQTARELLGKTVVLKA